MSINAVRALPAETMEIYKKRIEACALKCEESAQKASNLYDSARSLVNEAQGRSFLEIIMFGLIASMGTALLVLIFIRFL